MASGKPMRGVPAASVLNPSTIFTDACFKLKGAVRLSKLDPGVGLSLGDYDGPKCTPRNLPKPPLRKTCGYTAS